MTTTTEEPERVGTGTVHDLPNPLARAYGMAMQVGLIVDYIDDPPDAPQFLAILTMEVDKRGVRDHALIASDLEDDLKAEAIFFVLSIVCCNRDMGLDLSPWCDDGPDGLPFITVSRERVEVEKAGFGKLAVMMSKEAGIEGATSWLFIDPTDPTGERHIA